MNARTSRTSSRWLAPVALAAAAVVAPAAAHAQSDVAVKPHLLFVLDTSGSMTCDINSRTTCLNPSTQTHSPAANSCGVTYRSRVNDLRCVMTNVVNNVSDAVIGLARFRTTTCQATSCTGSNNNTFCRGTDAMTLLYPLIDTGIMAGGYPTDRATIIREQLQWFDHTAPSGACILASPCNNAGNPDINASGNTPLGGVLDGARMYFQSGLTAVGGANDRVVDNRSVPSPVAADPVAACRPRAVVLLTDGDETCSGNAPAQASSLLNLTVGGQPRPVRTYVIAMGTSVPYTPIENIATAGGTDNPRAPYRGFYANSEAEIAIAINDIIADSQLREYCNGRDDNCNGQVDEGYNVGARCTAGVGACQRAGTIQCVGGATSTASACNAVPGTPGAENTNTLCQDGVDNDCDGLTDCADPNCAATPRCSGSCTPTAEVCDGRDNDCDGMVDEDNPGGGTACGLTLGACRAGTTACVGGAIVCQGAVGPTAEVCDGIDNNCNGAVDEGLSRACGSSVGECRQGVQQCVGGAYSGPCTGAVGPTDEVCDGRDNDCDGMVDEGNPGGGAMCGNATGVCTPGTVVCAGGALTCTGGTRPSPEVCDGLDNDCNGVVDDGVTGTGMSCTPPGVTFPTTPPVGACRYGTTTCRGAMGSTCEGGVGPTPEVCNGIDDDCDGVIDEGLAGGPCGSSVGACRPGVLTCSMGRSVCMGEVGPTSEVCNGIDDDCDGETDEGNPGGGGACGEARGECAPGINVCRGGALVCEGGRGPAPEVCDGLDNDCDGSVDEDIPPGGPCGSSVGACRPGTERCVAGRVVCDGAIGPRPEECNCQDDDCNGMVDDVAGGGASLCGEGAVCAGAPHCQCLRPCADSEFPCPVGRVCQRVEGRDLCVGDPCADVRCGENERCENGACVERCAGVSCPAGTVCDPRNGRCVANSCRTLENCPAGQVCRNDRCEPNPCAGVTCPEGQACYNGACGATCAGMMCPAGQACFQGACRSDSCVGVTCMPGQACDPSTGACGADRCQNRRCGRDQACDPRTGDCVDDPCAVVRCPEGQACVRGSCEGEAARQTPPRDRVIATGGGGGGSCAVGPAPGSGPPRGGTTAASLGAMVAAAIAASRRRRRRATRGGEVVR